MGHSNGKLDVEDDDDVMGTALSNVGGTAIIVEHQNIGRPIVLF